jgi:hypothetical protein
MLTATLRGMVAHKLRLVLTTASIALGLYDWLRHGTEAGWQPVEEAR